MVLNSEQDVDDGGEKVRRAAQHLSAVNVSDWPE